MLNSAQIDAELKQPTDCNEIQQYRQSTVSWSATLSSDMAIILSPFTGQRKLVPFLLTIVDAIADKLELDEDGISLTSVKDTKQIKEWLDDCWAKSERDLWFQVVRDGKSYLQIQWKDTAPYFNVISAYDGMCGAYGVIDAITQEYAYVWNTWCINGDQYFDIYYPDRIEKYIKYKEKGNGKNEWQERKDTIDEEWPIQWVDNEGNPLGIALIEFSIGCSELMSAVQINRDLNENLLDLLAVSRTQGWPQRYLKGQRNADILTNSLGQPIVSGHTGRPIRKQLQLAPGSLMLLNDTTDLGQLQPSTIDVSLINKLLELLSYVTKVPYHYFSGEWPSGIALIMSESQLNHKVEGHQGHLSEAVTRMLQLIMRLSNYFGKTSFVVDQKIIVPWKSPEIETEELVQERETHTKDKVTDLYTKKLMTLRTALTELHPDWSIEEIEREASELEKVAAETQGSIPNAIQNQKNSKGS